MTTATTPQLRAWLDEALELLADARPFSDRPEVFTAWNARMLQLFHDVASGGKR